MEALFNIRVAEECLEDKLRNQVRQGRSIVFVVTTQNIVYLHPVAMVLKLRQVLDLEEQEILTEGSCSTDANVSRHINIVFSKKFPSEIEKEWGDYLREALTQQIQSFLLELRSSTTEVVKKS